MGKIGKVLVTLQLVVGLMCIYIVISSSSALKSDDWQSIYENAGDA